MISETKIMIFLKKTTFFLAPIEANILWSEAEEIEADSGISSKKNIY
jgi:hypothetical protein